MLLLVVLILVFIPEPIFSSVLVYPLRQGALVTSVTEFGFSSLTWDVKEPLPSLPLSGEYSGELSDFDLLLLVRIYVQKCRGSKITRD